MKNVRINLDWEEFWGLKIKVKELVRDVTSERKGKRVRAGGMSYINFVLNYETSTGEKMSETVAWLRGKTITIEPGKTKDSFILKIRFFLTVGFYDIFWLVWYGITGYKTMDHLFAAHARGIARKALENEDLSENLYLYYIETARNNIIFKAERENSVTKTEILNVSKAMNEINTKIPRWLVSLIQDIMHNKPEILISRGDRRLIQETIYKIIDQIEAKMWNLDKDIHEQFPFL